VNVSYQFFLYVWFTTVILCLRSPRMGDQFINVANFRQMCGRAGRMGLDKNGEAVLMVAGGSKPERDLAHHLLTADLDPLISTLHVAQGGGLEKLLLEMISCGRLVRETHVMDFVDCTLMKVQQPKDKVQSATVITYV
jgi:replicative superfamily II helicase